jgi:hypothetical protein
VGRRHEPGRLLVPGQHELDLRASERLDDVEVLLARNSEDAVDPLAFQRRDEKIGAFGHV